MPVSDKKRKLKAVGCDMEDIELELKRVTEEEIVQQLSTAFSRFGPIKQFRIGSYRIDLYLSKLKVAVECDEHGHVGYSQLHEEQRQAFIQTQLGCTFVRFDPYAPGFDVMEQVARILERLEHQ